MKDAYTESPTTTKEAILIINGRLGEIEKDVGEILGAVTGYMDKNNERVSCLELGQKERQVKIIAIEDDLSEHDKHLDRLDDKTTLWGSGGIVMAIIAGIIGFFKN